MRNSSYFQTLQQYLGVDPVAAERLVSKKENLDIDILTFEDRPFMGCNSLITNGVSDLKEQKGEKGNELIISFDPNTLRRGTDINAFMMVYIQLHYSKYSDSIKRGDYLMAPGIVLKGYTFRGVYATGPAYFPEDFQRINSSVDFLWLIPLYESECAFLKQNGYDRFETMLEEKDIDLTKLDRIAVV